MNVSHLTIGEIEHELLIRNLLFRKVDHESIKRRKLKDRMKEERDMGVVSTAFARTWRSAEDEIAVISSNLTAIAELLDCPRSDARQIEKLKTRLIHYHVRTALLSMAMDARKYKSQVESIEEQIDTMFHKHFSLPSVSGESEAAIKPVNTSISQALEEVRSEIAVLNETVVALEEEDLVVSTAEEGTGPKSIEYRIHEMESSMRRAEEILSKLTEYEEGKVENIGHLVRAFKDFVLQTSNQEKTRREQEIEVEKERKREAELNIERKKKLERLLVELYEKVKCESAGGKSLELPSDSFKKNQNGKESLKSQESNLKSKTNQGKMSILESNSSDRDSTSNTDVSESEQARMLLWASRRRKELSESSSTEMHNCEPRRTSRLRRKYRNVERKKKKLVKFSSPAESTRSSESESMSSDSNSSLDPYEKRRKRKYRKENISYRKNRKEPMKRIPIFEWRLKYDGKDGGRKLAEFLKEIKMRCRSEEVTDRELFRAAIHLFTGRAKDWYIEGIENRDFRNWSELKKELKREFLPPDLDFQLEVQATNRRQARGEKFADYFHEMQKIFQSMTKAISDRRKFNIIWRNMRHDYKNALTGANIRSLSKLRKYGRIVDENNVNLYQRSIDSSNQLRHNHVNELETDGRSKQKNMSSTSTKNTRNFTNTKKDLEKGAAEHRKIEQEMQDRKKMSAKIDSQQENGKEEPMEGSCKGTLLTLVQQYVRPPIGTCYNCRKMGHHYVECPVERQKFCRLCGFADVFTSACPFCQKNATSSV
ncbi:nexilin-like [Malaya genurostris]|uniref:nexilin-like n=1 Tax=Malaya genurostris TaxID=325434 RepID=UPI0026F3C6F8|nr:nexilin-like [Malaya genurostris]